MHNLCPIAHAQTHHVCALLADLAKRAVRRRKFVLTSHLAECTFRDPRRYLRRPRTRAMHLFQHHEKFANTKT